MIRTEKGIWFTDELREIYADEVAKNVQQKLNDDKDRKPHLRLSGMGPKCPCALWYSIHHPELAEPMEPWAEIKFTFGHMLEALAITLAKAAGHTVTGEQDELQLDGIVGHRDCVIDGVTVDVKSSSSLGYIKFKNGTIEKNDSFGYLDQLDGYVLAAHSDPLVLVKDRGCLLAVDKTLGHMCLHGHEVTSGRADALRKRIVSYREIVGRSTPPVCTCETVGDGSSGNIKLGVTASYSPYKYLCCPTLRTFLYAKGPVYLTHVARTPDVPELFRKHVV